MPLPFRLVDWYCPSFILTKPSKLLVDTRYKLTAFLHFQMESLGNVDISVKMKQKNVSANWYLEKMDSLIILEENMHLLTERLQKK